jgi:serine/threonine-protein kinase RsbT
MLALHVEWRMRPLRGSRQASAPEAAMPVLKSDSFPIRASQDVAAVRQAVRKWAVELGFSVVDQTKIVTAASELARNTLVYGGGGTARLETLTEGSRNGLRLTFEDQGPGIPDIGLALTDGYTTGGGLGLGLGGAKRLMSEFDLVSRVGEGTRITVTKWK